MAALVFLPKERDWKPMSYYVRSGGGWVLGFGDLGFADLMRVLGFGGLGFADLVRVLVIFGFWVLTIWVLQI